MKQFDLDITADRCPLTFVKTKLLIERMDPGDTARIRLKGEEPLENVPRSVRDHGHEVMSLTAAPDDPTGEVHLLVLRKR